MIPLIPPPSLGGNVSKAAKYAPIAKQKALQLARKFTPKDRLKVVTHKDPKLGITVKYTLYKKYALISIMASEGTVFYEFFTPLADSTVRARFGRSLPDTDYYITQTGISFFDGSSSVFPDFISDPALDFFDGLTLMSNKIPESFVEGTGYGPDLEEGSEDIILQSNVVGWSRQGYTWFGDTQTIVSEAGCYPGGESGCGVGSVNVDYCYPAAATLPSGTFDNLESQVKVDPVRGIAETHYTQSPDVLPRGLSGRDPVIITAGEAYSISYPENPDHPLRRVIRRSISSEDFGSRTFTVATNSLGEFVVYPTSDPGQSVTAVPSWPAWAYLDSTNSPYDHIEWCFDSTGTKAVCLPFQAKDFNYPALHLTGYKRFWGVVMMVDNDFTDRGLDFNDFEIAHLDHPGVYEVSINIELTGEDPGDFEVTLPTLQDIDPATLGFWPVAADYAFEDTKLQALNVAKNDLIFCELRVSTDDAGFITAVTGTTNNGQNGNLWSQVIFRTLATEKTSYFVDNFGVSIGSSRDDTFINDDVHVPTDDWFVARGRSPWSGKLAHVTGIDCRAMAVAISKFRVDYPDYQFSGDVDLGNLVHGNKLYGYGEQIYATGADFNQIPPETLTVLPSTSFWGIYSGAHRSIFKCSSWSALRVSPAGHIAAVGDMVNAGVDGGTPNIVPQPPVLGGSYIVRSRAPNMFRGHDGIMGYNGGTIAYVEGMDVIAIRDGNEYRILTHKEALQRVEPDYDYDGYKCIFDKDFNTWRLAQIDPTEFVRGEKISSMGCPAIEGYFI